MAKEKKQSSTPKKRASKPKVEAEDRAPAFTPDVLDTTIIALPLLEKLRERGGTKRAYDIIIDVNRDYPGGREQAQARIKELIGALVATHRVQDQGVHGRKTGMTKQYVFGKLRGDLIQELVKQDRAAAKEEAGKRPALYRVWPDFEVRRLTDRSIATVKADAARNAFGALGRGIVWAVVDSGIDANHRIFGSMRTSSSILPSGTATSRSSASKARPSRSRPRGPTKPVTAPTLRASSPAR